MICGLLKLVHSACNSVVFYQGEGYLNFVTDLKINLLRIHILLTLDILIKLIPKIYIMAKSQDAKKNVKKEPLKTAKEKKEEKRDKKSKRD